MARSGKNIYPNTIVPHKIGKIDLHSCGSDTGEGPARSASTISNLNGFQFVSWYLANKNFAKLKFKK